MSNDDVFGIEKGLKLTKLTGQKGKGRIHIKDAEMQVHVPSIGEAKDLEGKSSFKGVLGDYLEEVNTLQHEADAQIQRLVAGETEDLHEVTMAMDEAEASFELMMEIRNKLVDAYKELMRMQG